MTTPYSPDTAMAVATGITSAGYAEGTPPAWAAPLASYNAQSVEQRAAVLALDMRANLADLRRDLLPAPTATVRILCVGDSITLGVGSSDGAGYRPWLVDLLARQHVAAAMTVCAYGGQTLRYVAPLALAQLPAVQPDIVLVNLGTNDAVQPDMTDWQTRYGAFVDSILASSPTVRVACARIGLSRTTWMATDEAPVNAAVDAVVAARAAGGRVTSADMTVISERWTIDGTHPLDAGYLLAAQQWLNAITPWLPTSAGTVQP